MEWKREGWQAGTAAGAEGRRIAWGRSCGCDAAGRLRRRALCPRPAPRSGFARVGPPLQGEGRSRRSFAHHALPIAFAFSAIAPPGARGAGGVFRLGLRAARTCPNRRPSRRSGTTSAPCSARRAARGRARGSRDVELRPRCRRARSADTSASTAGSAMPAMLREPGVARGLRAEHDAQRIARRHRRRRAPCVAMSKSNSSSRRRYCAASTMRERASMPSRLRLAW